MEIFIYISVDILFIVSHLCFTYVKIEKEKKKENWTLIVCCKEDTHIAEWKNRCKTNKQKNGKDEICVRFIEAVYEKE